MCREYRCCLVVLTTLAVFSPALWLTADEISTADRAKLQTYLTETRDKVLAEAERLTDAQWKFKPGPDRWSVGEVVEHLALSEPFLFGLHEKVLASPAAEADLRAKTQGKDEMIRKMIPDRSQKATAPEPLRPGPGQGLGGRAEVLAAFKQRRAETIDYVNTSKADMRAHVYASQGPFGELDAYQWLLFIAAHTERHLAQIREVKADARFPAAATQE
jgi:hypothetical protein